MTKAKRDCKKRIGLLSRCLRRKLRHHLPRCFHVFVVSKLLYGAQVGYRENSKHKGYVEKVYELLKFKMGRGKLPNEEFLTRYNIKSFDQVFIVELLSWVYKFVFGFIEFGNEIFQDKNFIRNTRANESLQSHVKPLEVIFHRKRKIAAERQFNDGFTMRAVKHWNNLKFDEELMRNAEKRLKENMLKFKNNVYNNLNA